MRGRTIKIYLTDGDPKGIKECTINSSMTKAYVIPRNKMDRLKDIDELKRPGIYFLINSEQDFVTKPEIYIGETEDLRTRIKQHQKKDWKLAICFCSAIDKELNKVHARFLEDYSYTLALKINRCIIYNEKGTSSPTLSNSDKDLTLTFFDDLKIIIATLGFPIFDELKTTQKDLIFCKGKDASAKGVMIEDGLLVHKGSTCNIKESASARSWVIGMRQELKGEKILVPKENILEFTEDHLFNSPSAAAAVILGRRANGWIEWKNKDKKTIDEVIRKKEK